MDSLIEYNQFSEFISTMINIRDDELLFEVWLHKCYDKTFNEFKKDIQLSSDAQAGYMDEDDVKTTVKKSKDILSGFTPR